MGSVALKAFTSLRLMPQTACASKLSATSARIIPTTRYRVTQLNR